MYKNNITNIAYHVQIQMSHHQIAWGALLSLLDAHRTEICSQINSKYISNAQLC